MSRVCTAHRRVRFVSVVETIILVLRHHYSNVKLGVDSWILPLFFLVPNGRHTHTHTLHAVPNKLENVTDRLPLPRGHWDVLDHVWSLDQTTRVRDANGREECHSDTDCGSRRRLWKHYFH